MHFGRRPSALDGANQHPNRGHPGVAMNRQNGNAAKAAIERRQRFGETVASGGANWVKLGEYPIARDMLTQ